MIERHIDLECNLRGQTKAIVLYDSHSGAKRCVVQMDHRINTNQCYSMMCCAKPHKNVRIEDDGRVILTAKACRVCKRCIGNMGPVMTASSV